MMFEPNETLESALQRNVHDAVMDNIGCGDWTGRLVPADLRVNARVTKDIRAVDLSLRVDAESEATA